MVGAIHKSDLPMDIQMKLPSIFGPEWNDQKYKKLSFFTLHHHALLLHLTHPHPFQLFIKILITFKSNNLPIIFSLFLKS
jgi:hypothetical protein